MTILVYRTGPSIIFLTLRGRPSDGGGLNWLPLPNLGFEIDVTMKESGCMAFPYFIECHWH